VKIVQWGDVASAREIVREAIERAGR
jgi:inorganic pyrophosphatase